jgi:hypothetical protein
LISRTEYRTMPPTRMNLGPARDARVRHHFTVAALTPRNEPTSRVFRSRSPRIGSIGNRKSGHRSTRLVLPPVISRPSATKAWSRRTREPSEPTAKRHSQSQDRICPAFPIGAFGVSVAPSEYLEVVGHHLFLPSYAPRGHSRKAPGTWIAFFAASADSCLSADAPHRSKPDCFASARILSRMGTRISFSPLTYLFGLFCRAILFQ